MARPCILHTRQYRSVYEGMVNSLTSSGLRTYMQNELRRLQRSVICSCGNADMPACEAPAACPFLQESPETDNEKEIDMQSREFDASKDAFFSVRARRRRRIQANPPPELEAIVLGAQTELKRLAGMREHLDVVGPAISRLTSLLSCALAAHPPPAPKVDSRAWRGQRKARARLARRDHALSLQSYSPQPPVRRPPYAPLRWPPVAVTMAALKGQRAPPQQAAVRIVGDEEKKKRRNGSGAGNLATDDLLDVVEKFESKLWVGRALRRGRCSTGLSGMLADLQSGPRGLKHELRIASGHQHSEALQLLQQQVARLQRKERKAVMSHQRGRRDHHLHFRGGKEMVDMGELWPYK
ncbi:hypothetical protein Vretimale_5063 [Volvox reticuliferus]|uniref:Uncharacterized protein n=1 Tax=Volvox reticuliferus TaxID=1737510 RepID=A0A8J4DI35_9CHLO|nr:hypothetical protein Vretifemale_4077 [Volvox reticuliferus]GIL99998.1 hypothetical protein Vretimale_5063 [Volvox reticuliferus]